jgi:hypothetical protein
MIVQESDDDEQHGHANAADASAGAGNAFMTAQRGVDGASRDAKGNLKFNKNTKRAREMEREDVSLGSEFKAKVGRRCFACFVNFPLPVIPYNLIGSGLSTKGYMGSCKC